MRIVFSLSIVLLCFVNLLQAQTSRSTSWLKHAQWEFLTSGSEVQKIEILSAQYLPDTLKAGMVLNTLLECDQDAAIANFYFPGAAAYFNFYFNELPLQNELSDESFHAETGPVAANDAFQLSLRIQKDLSSGDVLNLLEYANFSLLSQVYICHFQTFEDAFFGGSLLEATIRNAWHNDVDGKLVATVLDLQTREVLAENNNCAFARQGSEIVVEVNFPEAEKLIRGNVYLFSLALLDKENNEEIIDELAIPMRF